MLSKYGLTAAAHGLIIIQIAAAREILPRCYPLDPFHASTLRVYTQQTAEERQKARILGLLSFVFPL